MKRLREMVTDFLDGRYLAFDSPGDTRSFFATGVVASAGVYELSSLWPFLIEATPLQLLFLLVVFFTVMAICVALIRECLSTRTAALLGLCGWSLALAQIVAMAVR